MKSKTIDDNVRNKIAETKSSQSVGKILCQAQEFDVPQSDPKLAVPSHRFHKHISLEEYKNLLASGKTVLQICKMTSKHVVYFYNALLDGRIKLTKDEFLKLYDAGKSLNDIADQNWIPRGYMSFLREFYGIKRKGATFQKRLANEVPLSDEAKSILVGSILGDGHIHPMGYFSEKHSEKQIGYLEWKASFLGTITTPNSWDAWSGQDGRSGTTIYSFSFRSKVHSFLHQLRNSFYDTNEVGEPVKRLPNNIEILMNELVLSVWFMDDGGTDWGFRPSRKNGMRSKISSQSFTFDDNIILSSVLKKVFDLECSVKQRSALNQFYLDFDANSSRKLLTIVKKHISPELLYKVNSDDYLSKTKMNENDRLSLFNNFLQRHAKTH